MYADDAAEHDVVLDLRAGARQADALMEHAFEADRRLLHPRHLHVHAIGRRQVGDGEFVHFRIEMARAEVHLVAQIPARSEEHTSELQSLMRISYAVFCLKKKKTKQQEYIRTQKEHTK